VGSGGAVKYRVEESGCQRINDAVVCFIAGVNQSLYERYMMEDAFSVVEVYLRFEGDSWAHGDRSNPVSGYVTVGGAFPMADRSWEMSRAELTAFHGRRLCGRLRCDKAILVPKHHDPYPVEVLLQSVTMPWSNVVQAEIKQPGVLRKVPALADW
jgi:hypothetical protein